MERSHRMPFGAEYLDGKTRFRLWAPKAMNVDVCLTDGPTFSLNRDENGWFELTTDCAKPGARYQFQINGDLKVPDPASRFQPSDVHGPSEVIDPAAFEWMDQNWKGRPWEQAVIYELHLGTFTSAGTLAAAAENLDHLCNLGVTAVELMPLSDFPGRRNWGYDGVLPYAPDSCYGRPEDLKNFVQSAHAKGLMVFLDVVYNHFGPDGNYLRAYSPEFFTSRHHTPWGDAINFDHPVVRDFFIHNALYWLEEYHFDGLRLDAVHAVLDDNRPDILTELAQTVRQKLQRQNHKRFIHLVLENENNQARYLRRELYDAQWNDDIHHAAHVLATGETDGYYSDYAQHPLCELGRCLAEGFAYQGDYSAYQEANRGEPSRDLTPTRFVSFLQNHDQIGNRAFGERILELAPPEAVRAMMAIFLLAPAPPLLFMGEEFGARTPFLFFCDFHGELANAVTEGRRNEFRRFQKFSSAESRAQIPDPNSEETFLRSKLDWENSSAPEHSEWFNFYRELLAIRHSRIVPLLRGIGHNFAGYHVAETGALSVDWTLAEEQHLRLLANPGSRTLSGVTQIEGEPLFSTKGATAALNDHQLPPWSVVWTLQI